VKCFGHPLREVKLGARAPSVVLESVGELHSKNDITSISRWLGSSNAKTEADTIKDDFTEEEKVQEDNHKWREGVDKERSQGRLNNFHVE